MGDYTEGEYRVGISFNPSKDEKVNQIKLLSAQLIDLVLSLDQNDGAKRCAAIAATEYESAAMWAVKAATKQAR